MDKVEIGNATIWNADCLQVLADMPENSVDLIATDPPYFRVKAEEWDRQWKDEAAFLSWIGELCGEWRRVLKPNGSLYVFASAIMAAKVEVKIGEYFNVLNNIRWDKPTGYAGNRACKEELRTFLAPCEKVIFAEQHGSGDVLRLAREKAGLSTKDLTEIAGAYGKVNHGGAVSNWEAGLNTPPEEAWEKMRAQIDLPPFTEAVRPFRVSAKVPHTDNWCFLPIQSYEGKHPCEKPVPLMRHIIEVSSRPGALVLDCFNGSGATGEAADETGRRFIGIEKDPHWFNYGSRRIETARAQQRLF
jgi:adenine-specific DNA-methyltransferase